MAKTKAEFTSINPETLSPTFQKALKAHHELMRQESESAKRLTALFFAEVKVQARNWTPANRLVAYKYESLAVAEKTGGSRKAMIDL